MTTTPTHLDSLKTRLDNSPHIRASHQDNDLVAYNFTRKAFWGNNWDNQTITARGLFMDGDTIVGRGYRKFFNLNQSHGYTDTQVREEFVSPVRVTTKRNGFLGIMFAYKGELLLWSKSGDTDYARAAKDLFDSHPHVNQDAIRRALEKHNVSLTWEIVLHNDPHVVEEPRHGMYLLDAIANTEAGEVVTEEFLVREYGVFTQTQHWGLDHYHALHDPLQAHQPLVLGYHHCVFSDQYVSVLVDSDPLEFIATKNPLCEGFVLRDAEGRMTKIKHDYYLQVKSLRTPIRRALAGKPINRLLPEWFPEELLEGTPEEVRSRLSPCLTTTIQGAEEVSLPALMKHFRLDEKYQGK